MMPTMVPGSTVAPSFADMFDSTPVTGERISCVTLSVSISTNGSSKLTGSPGRLNHLPIDNLTPALTNAGTRIFVSMESILLEFNARMPCHEIAWRIRARALERDVRCGENDCIADD